MAKQIGYQKWVIGFPGVCQSRIEHYTDKLCGIGEQEIVVESTTNRSITCYVKDSVHLPDWINAINEFIDGTLTFFGRCDRVAVVRFSEARNELDQVASQKAANLF